MRNRALRRFCARIGSRPHPDGRALYRNAPREEEDANAFISCILEYILSVPSGFCQSPGFCPHSLVMTIFEKIKNHILRWAM